MATINDLLPLSVVTGIVSRVYAPGNVLSRYFGMEIGGANVEQVSGRAYSFDLFDNTRTVAQGRAPGVGPANIPRNPIGKVNVTFPRSYEKLNLDYELLHNIRSIGKDAGVRDRMGMNYLEKQARFIKRRQNNFREVMVAGALRGSFGITFSGDSWYPVLSGGDITVDYQVPAGNKTQLDMLGAGSIVSASWATAGTDIPAHLDGISRGFQQLVGAPLALVVTSSEIWRYVLANTAVKAVAGTANAPYAEYELDPMVNEDGKKIGVQRGRIKALPWLDWLIYDGGLEVGSSDTYTRFYDGTTATFMIEPDKSWFKMVEGSEPVKESPWSPAKEVFGMSSWVKEWDEPARVELHSIQNAVAELNIPKGIAYGTLIGF